MGLLVLNLGGPRSLDDVRPFLLRLFADREIIRLPGGLIGQWTLSRLIVAARLAQVRRNYASIGGGSPIHAFTARQVSGVAERLTRNLGRAVRPYIAFRYTEPSAHDALRAMARDGIREVLVLTLYPHYSLATTGSSLAELHRAIGRTSLRGWFGFHVIDRWYDDPGYLDLLASRIHEQLAAWPTDRRHEVALVFSAHSLPLSFVEEDDPYPAHVAATVAGVLARLPPVYTDQHTLAYQSQTGPVRWLEPRTEHVLSRLGERGVRDVVLVPLSFVSDHIETLYEVDQLFAHAAARAGITRFRRTRAFNDDPAFLDVLADIASRALESPAEVAI
jgi:ferrochelatase